MVEVGRQVLGRYHCRMSAAAGPSQPGSMEQAVIPPSSRRGAVPLSTAAAGDLDGIRVFTLERCGRAQWLAYYGELARTFERIAVEPGTGWGRERFRLEMRSVPCRAHVVFYVELGGAVVGIVRVLRARQNAAALRWEEGMV